MKLTPILVEQNKPIMHYHAEFSGDGTDYLKWSNWDGQQANNYEQAIEDAKDEYQVDGSEYYPGVWIGRHFSEVGFDDDQSEEGPYRSASISGEACIIVQGDLKEGHPLFNKVKEDVQQDAMAQIQDAMEMDRDESERRSNPDRYYGVSNRDFR